MKLPWLGALMTCPSMFTSQWLLPLHDLHIANADVRTSSDYTWWTGVELEAVCGGLQYPSGMIWSMKFLEWQYVLV